MWPYFVRALGDEAELYTYVFKGLFQVLARLVCLRGLIHEFCRVSVLLFGTFRLSFSGQRTLISPSNSWFAPHHGPSSLEGGGWTHWPLDFLDLRQFLFFLGGGWGNFQDPKKAVLLGVPAGMKV